MSAQHAIDHAQQILQQVNGPVAVVYHADADGIASAAIVCTALERRGTQVTPLTPVKGQNVYDSAFRDEVAGRKPGATVVVDTGSRARADIAPRPCIVIDHHPTAEPPAVDCFVHDASAPASSTLAYAVAEGLADVEDRRWLVAVGLVGDLGEKARTHAVTREASARYGARNLQELVALINASGRAAAPSPDVALAALCSAVDPRHILQRDSLEGNLLRAMRAEVSAAIARARRVAPHMRGRWAIIEIDEPCRIHGVIASAWTCRLSPRIVLVANRGYSPSRVHLSVRSHANVDLRAALRSLIPDAGADYAAGHARATGAIIDRSTYDRLLAAIEREEAALPARPPADPLSGERSQ